MLELMDTATRFLTPFGILVVIVVPLVTISTKLWHKLSGTNSKTDEYDPSVAAWLKLRPGIGCILWLAFACLLTVSAVTLAAVSPNAFLEYGVAILHIPGMAAGFVLGYKPLDKPDLPTWLKVTKLTGLGYVVVVAAAVAIFSLFSYWTDLRNSCELHPDGGLRGAVTANLSRCVQYQLSQDNSPRPLLTGEQPLLYVAAEHGNLHTLDLLLRSGQFDPNLPTVDGDTPLHAAVRRGQPDLVCRLLLHGARSSIPNRDFITPLDAARDFPDPDMAELLKGTACLPAPDDLAPPPTPSAAETAPTVGSG